MAPMTGTPGVLQALRLNQLLEEKNQLLKTMENQSARLAIEEKLLIDSPQFQEQEIRSILGYTSKDELVFDFSPPRNLSDSHESKN